MNVQERNVAKLALLAGEHALHASVNNPTAFDELVTLVGQRQALREVIQAGRMARVERLALLEVIRMRELASTQVAGHG